MCKKVFSAALLLALALTVSARTKEEIKKEWDAARRTLNTWRYNRAYPLIEKKVLIGNPEYDALKKAEDDVGKAAQDYIDAEVAKREKGKELLAKLAEVDKELAKPVEERNRQLASSRPRVAMEIRKFATAEKIISWANKDYAPLAKAQISASSARFEKGIELMRKSDDSDAKAFAAGYDADLEKIKQLHDEMTVAPEQPKPEQPKPQQ